MATLAELEKQKQREYESLAKQANAVWEKAARENQEKIAAQTAADKEAFTAKTNAETAALTPQYRPKYETNVVQQLVEQRGIAERMENMGLTLSGLNEARQQGTKSKRAVSDKRLTAEKQVKTDKLMQAIDEYVQKMDRQQKEKTEKIWSDYQAKASKNLLDAQTKAKTEAEKAYKEQQKKIEAEEKAKAKAAAAVAKVAKAKTAATSSTPPKKIEDRKAWVDAINRQNTIGLSKGILYTEYYLDEKNQVQTRTAAYGTAGEYFAALKKSKPGISEREMVINGMQYVSDKGDLRRELNRIGVTDLSIMTILDTYYGTGKVDGQMPKAFLSALEALGLAAHYQGYVNYKARTGSPDKSSGFSG